MADTKPDKPGFFSRLFGRKAERSRRADAGDPEGRRASREAMPSPPPTAADDLTAAPPTVTTARPIRRTRRSCRPSWRAPISSPSRALEPEGAAPQEPIPQIVDRDGRLSCGPMLRRSAEAQPVGQPIAPAPAEAAMPAPAPDAGPGSRLVAAPDGRHAPHLLVPVGQRHRPLHQAQARRRDARGAGGRADPGRSRRRRPPCGSPRRCRPGATTRKSRRDEVRAILASEVEKTLDARRHARSPIDRVEKPFVILMVGVNGAGKTTTIGKLAQKFRQQGLKVMLAAGDTFRAAAIEQLKVWGERVGAPVIARAAGRRRGGPCLRRAAGGQGQRHRCADHRHGRAACRTRPG